MGEGGGGLSPVQSSQGDMSFTHPAVWREEGVRLMSLAYTYMCVRGRGPYLCHNWKVRRVCVCERERE